MANVTQIRNLESLKPYLGEGVWQAMEGLVRAIPPTLKVSDSITLYTDDAATATKAEIDDDAGSRPLVLVIEGKGEAGYVQMFDADADSVTVGSTAPDLVIPFGATSGEMVSASFFGPGWTTLWDTGLTIAVTTTSTGNTALTAANRPNIFVLYHAA